ncbi:MULTISPECIES: DUF1826 domain-containing protein [Pseudomonas]|jgi:hypothetical protein|uniref:DUF1826 domain-containing protein n=1 Tax=Pseudomonas putida (strain W619) TaxID=390235 RepID=B1JFN0_PSEPW|nr:MULTISPECIES: DUF1826 domain-containing protein [Pseudomonas]MDH1574978.1 DUF1826 domain-containing protein [Pseudomonas sp. GD03746]QQE84043.1 DUF1826 domain-containing protein [Pseudomonas putida]UTL81198.1 DUF1826 domain-containing protein [Pseudomonas putida]HEN8710176.1 DUF1826 domain-containing protein [Pseudomonas putida]HEN8715473.1 DUF1826 domain-containing protein [Pseudomonas putida]
MTPAAQHVDIRQVHGESPRVLTDIFQEGVNMAVWQRRLPAQVEDFAGLVVSLGQPLADQRVLDVDEHEPPLLPGFLGEAADLQGYEGFVADVCWLVSAYTCLLGARRVGLRVRVLHNAMCPRFHVDNVPVRLLTTYVGCGSEWLREGAIERAGLQFAPAPVDNIQRLQAGDVALLKGEKWLGNEGAGLIHRSPVGHDPRLLLSLDWLA